MINESGPHLLADTCKLKVDWGIECYLVLTRGSSIGWIQMSCGSSINRILCDHEREQGNSVSADVRYYAPLSGEKKCAYGSIKI
jgi:hypothetical protein